MEKLIYKVTKPYIHEMLMAIGVDFALAVLAFALFIAYFPEEVLGSMIFPAAILLVAAVKYAPLLIKCLLDRKKQIVIDKTGEHFESDFDFPRTNWFTDKIGRESLLTTMYYPEAWEMRKHKLFFRTPEGKVFKARCILSEEHYQHDVFTDISYAQEDSKEPILLRVKYLKYSKAILSIRMVGWPPDMNRRTKDSIDNDLGDFLRWTIKQ